MMKIIRTAFVGVLAGLALAVVGLGSAGSPAAAEEQPQYLATHRDWHTFQYTENGHRVCYMATRPTKEEPGNVRRGDVFLLVTHRPAENSRDVVSIVTGYTYKPGSEVTLTIGNNTFRLFTDNDTAWARDAATDRAIVQAMTNGSTMVVRGTSARGTNTTDTYSLRGFSAAHAQINQACGL